MKNPSILKLSILSPFTKSSNFLSNKSRLGWNIMNSIIYRKGEKIEYRRTVLERPLCKNLYSGLSFYLFNIWKKFEHVKL